MSHNTVAKLFMFSSVFACFFYFLSPHHPSQIKSSLLMFVSWVSCLPLKGTSNVHSDETKFPTVFFSVSLWVATFSNSGGSANTLLRGTYTSFLRYHMIIKAGPTWIIYPYFRDENVVIYVLLTLSNHNYSAVVYLHSYTEIYLTDCNL